MWSVITSGQEVKSEHADHQAEKHVDHHQPHEEEGVTEYSPIEVGKCSQPANYLLEQSRVTFHRALATCIASAGMTAASAAVAAGVSRARIDHWCGHRNGDYSAITFDRLYVMAQTSRRGREVAMAMANILLSHLHTHQEECRRELPDLVVDLHAEIGSVSAEWRDVWSDRHVTSSEAKRLDKVLADAERVVRRIRAELQRVIGQEGSAR